MKKSRFLKLICLCIISFLLLSGQSVFSIEETTDNEAVFNSAEEITKETQVGAQISDESEEVLYSDISGKEYKDAVLALNELGLVSGYEDGTFRGGNNLTRAEFVTMVMRTITPGERLPETEGEISLFSDVSNKHWAYNAISLAVKKGLINGFEDGNFYPDAQVTYNQAVKILVCALGYGQNAERKGAYPYGYLLEAIELGVIKIAAKSSEEAANRGLAAQLISNVLDLPRFEDGITARQLKTGIYNTYYVSPQGDDENPGTEEKPWKTLYHSVRQLKAGNMLILEDGDYFEEHTSSIRESGTEYAPIVVKARNKHKAKVTYSSKMICNTKFEIRGASYVRVENIMFRQEARATSSDPTPTADIILGMYNGSHGVIRGNHLTNAFEEGLKFHRVTNCIIEDNYVSEMDHEGLDAVDCTELFVRNNTFDEIGRVGIMIKGGSSDCQIYNNLIYNKDVYMTICGITVGGSTDPVSTRTPKKEVGFEMYSSQIYNNIIYTPTKQFRWGIASYGSKDCRVFNNIVSGASISSLSVFNSGGLNNKWEWDPPTRNLLVCNNIFADSPKAYEFNEEPENMISDYNLYSDISQAPEEKHSLYRNVAFVNPDAKNFRVRGDNPAKGAGMVVPKEFVGYDKNVRTISTLDYEGNERKDIWDIGIYQISK